MFTEPSNDMRAFYAQEALATHVKEKEDYECLHLDRYGDVLDCAERHDVSQWEIDVVEMPE